MITIPISKIESSFNCKVTPWVTCLGIDTASRSGWSIIKTTNKEVIIDYGFIEIKTKDQYQKYDSIIEAFKSIIKEEYVVVIEDTYYSRNANVFKFLSRIGAMIYTIAHLMEIKKKVFVSAVHARKILGLKCIAKKEVIQTQFKSLLKCNIDDIDIIDAIILALYGVIKTNQTTL